MKNTKRHHKHILRKTRRKRGGFLDKALAPLALFGLAHTFGRRHHKKSHKNKSRKHRK